MECRTAELESELRAAVAARVGEAKYGLWFGEGVQLGVDGDSLVVDVPNGFFREWIAGHFAGNLVEAAEAVAGRSLRLTIRVDDESETPLGDTVPDPAEPPDESRPPGPTVTIPGLPTVSPPEPAPVVPAPVRRRQADDRPRGQVQSSGRGSVSNRPARRLEDFVTGPCNRLAHAAAIEMAETAGSAFNPLVVHGGIGLGKTHLIDGLATAMRGRHPGTNIVQITAESFTNSFLDALRTGSLNAFRSRFRRAGALVVDDVHFLAAKKSTQDEFLHTFNALIAEGAPIVLASDQHPRLIARLTDELATRFLGGMVVKLEAPDPATRRAILRSKAAARGIDVPEAVLSYIAEHLRASVRELEGALHSVIAQARLTGKRIDLNLARAALRDTIRHTAQAVALKDIERAVCGMFGIDADRLKSDGRARAVSHPRMLAMYLARKHTSASYSEIGRFFGGRNHSTVISAEKKVVTWLRDEQRNGLLAGFETVGDILSAIERTLGA